MEQQNPDRTETATAVLTIIPLTMRLVAAELRQLERPIMPPQLMVLNLLFQEGAKNLTQLAESSAVSLPTMSGTIKTLVKERFVQRTRSETDRRIVLLEITPEGAQFIETIGQKIVARMATLLEIFTEEELHQIWSGLMVFQRALTHQSS